nr:MAG TPA: hypothetical protein [Caudoviricetes sp.]
MSHNHLNWSDLSEFTKKANSLSRKQAVGQKG